MKTLRMILLSLTLFLSASLQAQVTQNDVIQTLWEGLQSYRHANETQRVDSFRKSIPLLITYVDTYKNLQTRTFVSKMDGWAIVTQLFDACQKCNDSRIEGLDEFVHTYYAEQGKNAPKEYYTLMEITANYYVQNNRPEAAKSNLQKFLDNISSHSGDSTVLDAMKFSASLAVAKISISENNWNEAIKFMEQAATHSTIADKYYRQTDEYDSFANNLSTLIVELEKAGHHNSSLSLIQTLQQGVKEKYGERTESYLRVLASKTSILVGQSDMQAIKNNIQEIESLMPYVDNMDSQFRSMLEQMISIFHSTLQEAPTTTPVESNPKSNDTSFNNDCSEMTPKSFVSYFMAFADITDFHQQEIAYKGMWERITQESEDFRVLGIQAYNSCLSCYIHALINCNHIERARGVLSEAEHQIMQLFPQEGTSATRTIDMLSGEVCSAANDPYNACKHLITAKQKFEQVEDKSMLYLRCLSELSSNLVNSGRPAYAKIILDELNNFIENNIGSNFSDNSDFQSYLAEFASQYMSMGYYKTAKDLLQRTITKYGKYDNSWHTLRYRLAFLHLRDHEWEEAAELMLTTMNHTTNASQQIDALHVLIQAESSLHSESACEYLTRYNKLMHNDIQSKLSTLTDFEKDNTWAIATENLTNINNFALGAMNDHVAICQSAYDNALYAGSMQELGIHNAVKWKDVQNMLDTDEAAVEFMIIPKSLYKQNDFRYAALVLRKDDAGPIFVDLCHGQAIDSLFMDVIHTDISLINHLYAAEDTLLYNRLWRKIEPLLGNIRHIYYTPTYSIRRINFMAMSDGHHRLSDRYDIIRTSSTAEISKIKQRAGIRKGNAVVYGGVAYDESIEDMQSASASYARPNPQTLSVQRSLSTHCNKRGAIVSELPGALQEATDIADILKKGNFEVSLLTAKQANEESVKALSGKAPKILHFATHGFWLSTNTDQAQHRSVLEIMGTEASERQRAMLFTGLLMAGSHNAWYGNHLSDQIEDGILTSYEISNIDLTGCQLVVLSACETGMARFDSRNGEDFGILRALKLAHAGTIIATLWEVPDNITPLLMQKLYREITNGLPPRQALEKAQAEIRRLHPDPYFWAAFFAID